MNLAVAALEVAPREVAAGERFSRNNENGSHSLIVSHCGEHRPRQSACLWITALTERTLVVHKRREMVSTTVRSARQAPVTLQRAASFAPQRRNPVAAKPCSASSWPRSTTQ